MTQWLEEIDVAYGGVWRLQLKMDRILFEGRSDYQDIVVFENGLFGRMLALDGIVQTTEKDEFFYHEMAVHPAMLAHGDVRRALIIGGGDGGALEEMLKHPGLEAVTMVELDAAVIQASKTHLRRICGQAFEDPRAEIVIADGVAFVAQTEQRYDFVLIDSTDPVGFGTGELQGPGQVLFSREFYAACRRCMNPGAVLVSQNAVPFVDEAGLAAPLGNLRAVFPKVACYRVTVPTFYGGEMVFSWASDRLGGSDVSLEDLRSRFTALGIETRLYTPEVHKGAFALPPYLVELIGSNL